MFDPAALSLPTAVPTPVPAAAQNGGNAALSGDELATAPTIAFEAVLALQIAPAEPADAPSPESGKTLPDAANLVAALPPPRVADAPARPVPAKAKPDAQARADAEHDALEEPDPAAIALPDPSLIAAIFAAPDRLTATPAAPAPTTPQDTPQPAALPQQASAVSPGQPQALRVMVDVAEAAGAQIDLMPQQESAAPAPQSPAAPPPATTQLVAARQARQAAPQRGDEGEPSPPANLAAAPARVSPSTEQEAPEARFIEAPTAVALPLDQPAPAPDPATPHAVRAVSRPERVDFATLVDTLARAREDAAPRTVNIAVSHTEFGRVSLRFDHDADRGLSVAMSSADPGFARAVSATAEARGMNETGDQGQQSPQQQAQQAPSEARAQAGQGDSQRHRPQQAERAPSRPLANPSAPTREDPPAPDGTRGIYA